MNDIIWWLIEAITTVTLSIILVLVAVFAILLGLAIITGTIYFMLELFQYSTGS